MLDFEKISQYKSLAKKMSSQICVCDNCKALLKIDMFNTWVDLITEELEKLTAKDMEELLKSSHIGLNVSIDW